MKNTISTSDFLVKSFIAGVIASGALYFYWDLDNNVINRLLSNFHWYFGGIIIFWLWLGNSLQVKGWLIAGFIGSLIYSLLKVLTIDSLAPIIGFQTSTDSLWAAAGFIAISMLTGALGAIPQWLVSKDKFPYAYRWIIANAIGYGILQFSSWFIGYLYDKDLFSFQHFEKSLANVQAFDNLFHIFQYGIFGMILGVTLLSLMLPKKQINLDIKGSL